MKKINVGLSDHTTTNSASVLAVALGANAIEKHFKLNKERKLNNIEDYEFQIFSQFGDDGIISFLVDNIKIHS